MAVKHSSRQHALLSASGAHRWLNCTPSAKMEEEYENKSSSYAAEGTLAHEFADRILRIKSFIGKRSVKAIWEKELVELRESDLYTDEMEEQVAKYTEYVLEEWVASRKQTQDAILNVEEKVDLTDFIEDGFGTCDAVIIADGVMEVIDLKYGKGVKVSAVDNPQLRLYALGALYAYSILYDVNTVKMTIVQPRLDSIYSETITADALFD